MRDYRGEVGRVLIGFCLVAAFVMSDREAMGQARREDGGGRGAVGIPSVLLREAPVIQMPGAEDFQHEGYYRGSDSNNPAHWDGETFYLFNSWGHPWRSSGPDLFHLGTPVPVHLGKVNDRLPIWIESTWKDEDGTLYGTYHFEPDAVCVSNSHDKSVAKMGWIKSTDNGLYWEDLGFFLAADPGAVRCDTVSPWAAGGYGAAVAFLDKNKEYFYFFADSYDSRLAEQGLLIARMRYADRNNPSGKVWKWYQGNWSEPGLGGHVTPIFPAETDYHREGGRMFWGPVVHWNTYLDMYVMSLNHTIDKNMTQDGIYIAFNSDLSDPRGWTAPRMFLGRAGVPQATAGAQVFPEMTDLSWYAEVIGTGKGETDKLVGRTGRLFLGGQSRLEIIFLKPGEKLQ